MNRLLEPPSLLGLVAALLTDSVQNLAGGLLAAEVHPGLLAVHRTLPVIEPPAP